MFTACQFNRLNCAVELHEAKERLQRATFSNVISQGERDDIKAAMDLVDRVLEGLIPNRSTDRAIAARQADDDRRNKLGKP